MVDLGRHLFFDPRLILSEEQSCASCHSPHMGYADGVARDLTGHKDWKRAKRNSPSLYNLAWAPVVHWDGRTPAGKCFTPQDTQREVCLPPLESQAYKSMRSRKVYEGFLPKVKAVAAYRDMFAAAFPTDGAITHLNMAIAIAAFERTLVSDDSPYDRYIQGNQSALSPGAKRGLVIFQGKGRCIGCHGGPNFTDWGFHNIGVKGDDPGRGGRVKDEAAKKTFHKTFKTPGLRNVALTAPYMHDGSLAALEDVIEFYDRGGDDATNLDPQITPLGLTDKEKWDLVEFLHALTDPVDVEIPVIPGL
ncbi:MAG: cytochrome-c peroxidase [Gammaproteobacteria bacterium]